jgi:hypothetical protein
MRDPGRGVGIEGLDHRVMRRLERRSLTGEIAGVLDAVLGVPANRHSVAA